ncbi:hypothetical protein [Primorskyibacter marinus]|uniref:hypothetical protein n=1 Tax=Primorskyibacter marinus TaxID=1977320 RepID=UPI000E3019BE|nr:hypothetical protein [Primorskyibacter marinus]
MWWRFCGNIAETNLRVLQTMTQTGVKRANMAAVPMLAFGVYAARSITPVQDTVAPSPSALSVARQNAHRMGVEASPPDVPVFAPLSHRQAQDKNLPFADSETCARAV